MSKLDELMALADKYVNESVFIACGHPDASQIATDEALDAFESALKAVLEDSERYRLIEQSKAGTIRLDGNHDDKSDYRWASPQYIHWGGELTLDAAIDAARKA